MLKTFFRIVICYALFFLLGYATKIHAMEANTKRAMEWCEKTDKIRRSYASHCVEKWEGKEGLKHSQCEWCKEKIWDHDSYEGGVLKKQKDFSCYVAEQRRLNLERQWKWDELVREHQNLPSAWKEYKITSDDTYKMAKKMLLDHMRLVDAAEAEAAREKLASAIARHMVAAEKPAHTATQALVGAAAAQLTAAQIAAAERSQKAHATTHALVKGAAAASQSHSTILLAAVDAYGEASASRHELLMENMSVNSAPASAAGAAAAPHDDEAHFRRMAAESLAKKAESEAKKAALEAEEADLRVQLLRAQLAALKLGTDGGAPAAAGAGAGAVKK